jgi:hypothetical protein
MVKKLPDAKKRADLQYCCEHLPEVEHRHPVGMLNVCKDLVKYWDKVADPAKNLAKAHRAIAKAAGGVG